MRIWIDLSNSPHPLLFAPIARRFCELGHVVGLTARDNAQTAELALERFPDAAIIGGQSPRSRRGKVQLLIRRTRDLRRWAQAFQPDIALSHNSYAQIVAAKSLGMRVVTAMDYEGQPANHLAFRLADAILMPQAVPSNAVRRQGATASKLYHYPGFKEQIYLGDFSPDPNILKATGVSGDGKPVVVIRTPPSRATYHRFGNPLFEEVIQVLGRQADLTCVVLPRHPEQRAAIQDLGFRSLVLPDRAVDSRSLMYGADLLIGAGGTMTREAALMGIPTYSVFAGKLPAVDQELVKMTALRCLHSVDEILPITRRKSDPLPSAQLSSCASTLVDVIVSTTLGTAAP